MECLLERHGSYHFYSNHDWEGVFCDGFLGNSEIEAIALSVPEALQSVTEVRGLTEAVQ